MLPDMIYWVAMLASLIIAAPPFIDLFKVIYLHRCEAKKYKQFTDLLGSTGEIDKSLLNEAIKLTAKRKLIANKYS